MNKTLNKLTIKLCENLPLDFTLYEKNGFCEKPNEYCDYCKKNSDNTYFCNKKTYIPTQKLKLI